MNDDVKRKYCRALTSAAEVKLVDNPDGSQGDCVGSAEGFSYARWPGWHVFGYEWKMNLHNKIFGPDNFDNEPPLLQEASEHHTHDFVEDCKLEGRSRTSNVYEPVRSTGTDFVAVDIEFDIAG